MKKRNTLVFFVMIIGGIISIASVSFLLILYCFYDAWYASTTSEFKDTTANTWLLTFGFGLLLFIIGIPTTPTKNK